MGNSLEYKLAVLDSQQHWVLGIETCCNQRSLIQNFEMKCVRAHIWIRQASLGHESTYLGNDKASQRIIVWCQKETCYVSNLDQFDKICQFKSACNLHNALLTMQYIVDQKSMLLTVFYNSITYPSSNRKKMK